MAMTVTPNHFDIGNFASMQVKKSLSQDRSHGHSDDSNGELFLIPRENLNITTANLDSAFHSQTRLARAAPVAGKTIIAILFATIAHGPPYIGNNDKGTMNSRTEHKKILS